MKKRSVTLNDIAAEAGVSTATVSMALNGKPGISDPMRAKIIHIATELGYPLQRSRERLSGVKTIYLIDHTFDSVEMAATSTIASRSVVFGIRQACEESGLRLEVVYGSTLPPVDLQDNILGVIEIEGSLSDERAKKLNALPCPVVLVGAGQGSPLLNTVSYDHEGILYEIVHRLCELGHRDIALICYGASSPVFMERRVYWQSAMLRHGLDLSRMIAFPGNEHAEQDPNLISNLTRWIEEDCADVTAFVGLPDYLAISTMQALRRCGRTPGDGIAFVGFDDTQYALITDPPLASVRLQDEELGRQAVRRLLDLIDHPNQPILHQRLPLAFVERESLCAPK